MTIKEEIFLNLNEMNRTLDDKMDYLIKQDEDGKLIYNAGKDRKEFDYEKGLNALIKKDEHGLSIYKAGIDWPEFDYEKGLNALIKKNIHYVLAAGKAWPKFDYEKGLNALAKVNNYTAIVMAGENWPEFNFEKALEFLKNNSEEFYNKALKVWPKTLSDVKKDKPETDKTKFKKKRKLKL